jgi:ABC-type phosphate transport system substrate-binding protein
MAFKASALAVPAVVAGLVLQGRPAAAQATIAVDGSSTVFPVTEVVAEEFRKANRGVRVTDGSLGTGGAFRKFCRGETAVQDVSRPMLRAEMEECRQAVARDQNALGYIPFADVAAHADALKTVAIDGGQGCAQPPQEAVLNGTCSPLSRPLFYLSRQDQELVRYVPLPQEAYDVGMRRLSAPRAGA